MRDYEIAIIGGGIVGLSTGMALAETYPEAKIIVLEKEKTLAMHQTGHNSGVIHSGIYYKPGSLKAMLAKKGNRSMIVFCKKHHIPYEQCGKVIVATTKKELPLLDRLYERGLQNGLDIHMMNMDEAKELEPYLEGLKAIYVPSTGIVDYTQVAKTFASIIEESGGELSLNTEVKNIEEKANHVVIGTSKGIVNAKTVINCGGLHSDRIAKLSGILTDMRIVPFRGEYYELKVDKRHVVNNLIYPVPNPDFPFLGVHFTRMIDGRVLIGPNAVLGLKREGYKKTDIHWNDLFEVVTYGGFWRVAISNVKEGTKEMVRSLSKKRLVKELQRFIPDIGEDDLLPAKAGVRAQALGQDGKMIDDFFIVQTKNMVHVLNAPSPAATASIEIGNYIAKRVTIGERKKVTV